MRKKGSSKHKSNIFNVPFHPEILAKEEILKKDINKYL